MNWKYWMKMKNDKPIYHMYMYVCVLPFVNIFGEGDNDSNIDLPCIFHSYPAPNSPHMRAVLLIPQTFCETYNLDFYPNFPQTSANHNNLYLSSIALHCAYPDQKEQLLTEDHRKKCLLHAFSSCALL